MHVSPPFLFFFGVGEQNPSCPARLTPLAQTSQASRHLEGGTDGELDGGVAPLPVQGYAALAVVHVVRQRSLIGHPGQTPHARLALTARIRDGPPACWHASLLHFVLSFLFLFCSSMSAVTWEDGMLVMHPIERTLQGMQQVLPCQLAACMLLDQGIKHACSGCERHHRPLNGFRDD